MKYFLITILLLSSQFIFSQAQKLKGKVFDENNQPVVSANVFWKNQSDGVVSNNTGEFEIDCKDTKDTLVVAFLGYKSLEIPYFPKVENSNTIDLGILKLKIDNTLLNEATITEKKSSIELSTLKAQNIESLSSRELTKAACCNLSESFETSAVVDASISDAVTGVKEITFLGLRSQYAPFLIENRPAYSGVGNAFAMEFIPGTWVDGIALTKGSSGVQNGMSNIAGLINVDLQKPMDETPSLFVNLFANVYGRKEFNVHVKAPSMGKVKSIFLLHADDWRSTRDHNNDGFFDMPHKTQYNGMYRAFYDDENICAQFSVQHIRDERLGGQLFSIENPYRFGLNIIRTDVFSKVGLKTIAGKKYRTAGIIAAYSDHNGEGGFGKNPYMGNQKSFYFNALFNDIFGNTDHKYALGVSFQNDVISESLLQPANPLIFSRTDRLPGAFFEYTYSHFSLKKKMENFVLVAGIRSDFHNIWGLQINPRIYGKYNFSENSIVRASVGRGSRLPIWLSDQFGLLATNRIVNVQPLTPEIAWNMGGNFTKKIKLGKLNSTLSIDVYRTIFEKMVVADPNQGRTNLEINLVNGPIINDAILVSYELGFWKGFSTRMSWKYTKVPQPLNGILVQRPLVPLQRGLITLDYSSPNQKWKLNQNIQITGIQSLPDVGPVQDLNHVSGKTPRFATWNAQATRSFKNIDFYLGVENILDFVQHHPIIFPNIPNSPYFDATQIYAPVMGRVVYGGLRYTLQ
jgi:outer membrane receptor for ferrienterochelin and colicins